MVLRSSRRQIHCYRPLVAASTHENAGSRFRSCHRHFMRRDASEEPCAIWPQCRPFSPPSRSHALPQGTVGFVMRLGTPTSLDSVPSQNWGSSAPSWPICRPEEGLECSLGRSEIEHHSCHNPDSIPISTNVRNYSCRCSSRGPLNLIRSDASGAL